MRLLVGEETPHRDLVRISDFTKMTKELGLQNHLSSGKEPAKPPQSNIDDMSPEHGKEREVRRKRTLNSSYTYIED